MIHVIYRSYGGENKKGRPAFYSKLVALVSIVHALAEFEGKGEIIFLNDGPIPRDRLHVMERSGEILARSQLGMRGSMRTALALPAQRGWPDRDLVWFAEDDYLYRADSISALDSAAKEFPDAAYFALYATIGNRLPNGFPSDDARVPDGWRDSEPRLVQGHPWRRALSTTSTFGARVEPLLEDRPMMHAAMWSGGAWDHTTCLIYQGYAPYPLPFVTQALRQAEGVKEWTRRAAVSAARLGLNGYQIARRRAGLGGKQLIAPDPALATHMETAYLALGTDWSAIAERTTRWGEEQGLI